MAPKKKPASGKAAAPKPSVAREDDSADEGEPGDMAEAAEPGDEAEPAGGADEPGDDADADDLDELEDEAGVPIPVAKPAAAVPAVPARYAAPPPKRNPGGPPIKSTQAFEHGTAASGAKLIKPGFATSKAADLAFALGFPHLEYIVDDHPDDSRAEMIAYERRSYRLGWPRNVAIRWCRITACKGFKRTPQGATELDGAGKKAIKNGSPLSFEEVGLTLKSIFSDTSSYEDLGDLVRLFEAFMGPELIVTSLVDALEKSSNNVWNHQDHDRALVMHHLGFLLLRLPASMSDKLRSRLAAVFDRRVKALPNKELGPRKGERGSLLRALDVVLNGKVGAERSGERNEDTIHANDLVHVLKDEAFVRAAATQQHAPDSRLTFLGGEPVLEHLLDVFLRLRGLHNQLIDNFAEVSSPKVTELLQKIAKGKEAPERAAKILAEREK
jgi:hypothetical protein